MNIREGDCYKAYIEADIKSNHYITYFMYVINVCM